MAVDVEEALSNLALAQADIAAIVGTKVFPNRVPIRESLPAVIFRRLSGGSVTTINAVTGVKRAVFQVESWSAESQLKARQLNLAVQELEGYRGEISGWWIQRILVNPESDQDNPQIPIHAEDLGFFCSFCELDIAYNISGL